MATQGPNAPGTMASVVYGDVPWTNPNNAKVSDDARASAGTMNNTQTSEYLQATNFGFSIPSGATIDGITAEIERRAGIPLLQDASVRIVKGGTVSGNDKAVGGNWPSTDTFATYGGAADLWGVSWTNTDINASTFGVVLAAIGTNQFVGDTGEVDFIRITINYTAAGGAGIVAYRSLLGVGR